MRYFLLVVNTKHNEVHVDKEFKFIDDLESYVRMNFVDWTSIVMTALPVGGKDVVKQ